MRDVVIQAICMERISTRRFAKRGYAEKTNSTFHQMNVVGFLSDLCCEAQRLRSCGVKRYRTDENLKSAKVTSQPIAE